MVVTLWYMVQVRQSKSLSVLKEPYYDYLEAV